MFDRLLLIGLLLTMTAPPLLAADTKRVTVSAAISLKPAFLAMQPGYEKATGDKITFNFGASGALLSQIKAGAPADLFISAATKQVEDLLAAGLGDAATRSIVARGRLVLIVPANQPDAVTSLAELATDKVKRLAIGQPKTVPVGDYASQALARAGLSAKIEKKLIQGANVRQVLDYVVRGEVDAGLVYATDAREAGEAVRVVERIDASEHEPIVYPAVILKNVPHRAAAERFVAYLLSQAGQAALVDRGLDPAASATATTRVTTMPAQ
jgi:molybdate transport system substrate-binding protein